MTSGPSNSNSSAWKSSNHQQQQQQSLDSGASDSFLAAMGWDNGGGSGGVASWDLALPPLATAASTVGGGGNVGGQAYSWRSAAMDWSSSGGGASSSPLSTVAGGGGGNSSGRGWKDPSAAPTNFGGSQQGSPTRLPSLRARNTSSHSSIDSQVKKKYILCWLLLYLYILNSYPPVAWLFFWQESLLTGSSYMSLGSSRSASLDSPEYAPGIYRVSHDPCPMSFSKLKQLIRQELWDTLYIRIRCFYISTYASCHTVKKPPFREPPFKKSYFAKRHLRKKPLL